MAPAPAGVAAGVDGREAEARSPKPPAFSSEPTLVPRAAPPCGGAAPTAPSPSRLPDRPLRSREEAPAPRGAPCPTPPSERYASPPSNLEQPRWPVSPVELTGEPWQALLLRGEAPALASPTRRPTQPIRRRLAADAPRPSLPRPRAASPPPCPRQPWRPVSPAEPSEEPWQALLLTEEQALLSLHTDHPGRLDQEQHVGAAPSWPTGWHLRTLLARAPGSQPAPSSPSQCAFASPCPEPLGLAAEGAPPAAPATRAPRAGAPAGAASSSRCPRLRPPPARVPLARRRRLCV
eukprot:scaffold7011_cov112-Isochrysis_galbana.AAC.7